MILYNTTFFGASEVKADFVEFLRDIYMPTLESEGMERPLAAEIRGGDSEEGFRIAVQCLVDSEERLADFCANVQPALLQEAFDRWGKKVLCMPSVMDCIDL